MRGALRSQRESAYGRDKGAITATATPSLYHHLQSHRLKLPPSALCGPALSFLLWHKPPPDAGSAAGAAAIWRLPFPAGRYSCALRRPPCRTPSHKHRSSLGWMAAKHRPVGQGSAQPSSFPVPTARTHDPITTARTRLPPRSEEHTSEPQSLMRIS